MDDYLEFFFFFFLYTPAPASLKSWVHPCLKLKWKIAKGFLIAINFIYWFLIAMVAFKEKGLLDSSKVCKFYIFVSVDHY